MSLALKSRDGLSRKCSGICSTCILQNPSERMILGKLAEEGWKFGAFGGCCVQHPKERGRDVVESLEKQQFVEQ